MPRPDFPDSWVETEKVRAWKKSLAGAGCTLRGLELIAKLDKRDGGLLFALAKAQASDADGHALLPYVLFRGAAVVVVPRILPAEGGEPLFLTVTQRRTGHGRESLEFPAGMLDGETDPGKVGAKELAEETGWLLSSSSLIPLWDSPLYPSPGLSDESIHFFGVSGTWDRAERRRFEGALSGVEAEGERIRVGLKTAQAIREQTTSLQTLLALRLFQEHAAFCLD